jgi:hypothetical protein
MKKKRTTKKRDYSYDKAYNKRTVKERSQRNKARRVMLKSLTEKYGKSRAKEMMDGMDVDHKRTIKDGGSNNVGNLRLQKPSVNRARKT